MGGASYERGCFLVVDDDALLLRAVARLLRPYAPVRTAGTLADAVHCLSSAVWAGFVFRDRLLGGCGLKLLAKARARGFGQQALIMGNGRDPSDINRSNTLRAEYVCIPFPARVLGRFARNASVLQEEYHGGMREAVEGFGSASGLTPAETFIVEATVCGFDREEIASLRQIALSTYKTQVASILRKTGAVNLGQIRNQILRQLFPLERQVSRHSVKAARSHRRDVGPCVQSP
jgi:DNA-binding NarL/FixJ family response regulator